MNCDSTIVLGLLETISQKSHGEFQAVNTEVEHTVFAIAAVFCLFKLTFNFVNV